MEERVDGIKKNIGVNFTNFQTHRQTHTNPHQDIYTHVKSFEDLDYWHASKALDGYIDSNKSIKSGEFHLPSVEKDFKSAINSTALEFGASPVSIRDMNKSEVSVIKRNKLFLEHVFRERNKYESGDSIL